MAIPIEHGILPRLKEISDQLIAEIEAMGYLEDIYRLIRIAVNKGAEAGMDYSCEVRKVYKEGE